MGVHDYPEQTSRPDTLLALHDAHVATTAPS